MTYKGYRIEDAEMRFPFGVVVHGYGIFAGEQLLTMADSTSLAKKLINQRLKLGIWKEQNG